MFASAAAWAGADLVAMVLSGLLDDGAVGAATAAGAGGRVLVQADARFAGMPRATLAAVPDATAAPLADLPTALVGVVRAVAVPTPRRAAAEGEPQMTMADSGDPQYLAADETRLTRLVCPDCGGSLAQLDLPTISYYRCHVGHQWSPQSLAAAQTDTAETKLWAAAAALEEEAALHRRLATTDTRSVSDDEAAPVDAATHRYAAQRATHLAETIKQHLADLPPPDPHDR
jgi:two-component system chemotaxis response regulator CheB